MNLARTCGSNKINRRSQPALGTMMGHTQIAVTSRDRFMQAAQKEMAKFERQEIEFRKQDRKERAAELQMPMADNETSIQH
jgi:hypothetical protein